MDSVEFCYWLQGYFELNPNLEKLSEEQIEAIKKRLNSIVKPVGEPQKHPIKIQPYPHRPTFDPPARC